MRNLLVLLALSVLVANSGCIFKSSTSQASSESSSKASSSPFRSSSKSSSPEKVLSSDVAETTRSWTLSGGDIASLQRDISRLAADEGISDWESHKATWEGVGRGLKRAGVQGARFEQLQSEIAGGDQERMQWIASGYKSE